MNAVKILERGEASAVLVIPQDFSKNFYSHSPTELAFLADGSNILQVSYATTPISLISGNFAAQYNQLTAIAHSTPTLSPAPISMSLRMSGNSVQGYLEFYIYGVMLLAAIFEVPFRGEIWQMLLICAAILFVAENLIGLLALTGVDVNFWQHVGILFLIGINSAITLDKKHALS